jgi:hypothetical protein
MRLLSIVFSATLVALHAPSAFAAEACALLSRAEASALLDPPVPRVTKTLADC